MPVLIAAVNRDLDIVIPLASKLLAGGGEVRCYLEYDDHELRTMGCKIAVGDLSDSYTMGAALTNVHTFIPLLADPLSFAGDVTGLTAFGKAALEAATAARPEQTILPISAAGQTGQPVFESLRAIERSFQEQVEPLLVLRTNLVAGPQRPLRVAGPQDAKYEVSCITVEALTTAIAAADDQEGTHGVQALESHPTGVTLQISADSIPAGLLARPVRSTQ